MPKLTIKIGIVKDWKSSKQNQEVGICGQLRVSH